MKKLFYSFITLLSISAAAQVGIGVATANINASAQLEVASTTKGFLPPRMIAAQREAISTPAAGLVLWCTNCGAYGELQVFNGTEWTNSIGGPVSVPVFKVIGDSYQGGIVFYILQDGDSGFDSNLQHGLISETQDQDVFSSWFDAQNKINISSNHSVAGQKYTDWRLPTKKELSFLYLQQTVVGNFMINSHYYWSSTASSNTEAYLQDFTDGASGTFNKSSTNVLAIRAIRSY